MFNRSSKKQAMLETTEDTPSNKLESGGNDMPFVPKSVPPIKTDPALLAGEVPLAGELERVRDLLFGKQTKATEERLAGLENQLQDVRRELTGLLEARFSELNKSFSSQLEALRKELLERSDQQAAKQGADIQSIKQSLTERVDLQEKEQTEKLRTAQRTLSERIDSLVTDSNAQLKKTHQEISARIETLNTEQVGRINNLQQETSQRDDALRKELIALGDALGNQKVSRREMTQLLVELAHRLQGDEPKS